MSKKDSIKESIGTLRTFAALFLTSIFGVLGYAIANIESLNFFKMIAGSIVLIFLVSVFAFIIKKYKEQIKLLEELE